MSDFSNTIKQDVENYQQKLNNLTYLISKYEKEADLIMSQKHIKGLFILLKEDKPTYEKIGKEIYFFTSQKVYKDLEAMGYKWYSTDIKFSINGGYWNK